VNARDLPVKEYRIQPLEQLMTVMRFICITTLQHWFDF